MKKYFTFLFPIMQWTKDIHRSYFLHVADFEVNGFYILNKKSVSDPDSRYEYKITAISYEGHNAFPMLEAFTTLKDVQAACVNHIDNLVWEMLHKTSKVISMDKAFLKVITA